MKCINKKNICLLLLLCTLIFSGCGKTVESVTFSNAYDIYETSKKYQLISTEDTSLHGALPYFASNNCVSDGKDLGTDKTSSYVAGASGVFNLTTKDVLYAQNIYAKMYPASTIKAFVMASVYDQIRQGKMQYSSGVYSLLWDMITVSDNECYNELVRRQGGGSFVGGTAVVNQYLRKNGYKNTGCHSSLHPSSSAWSSDGWRNTASAKDCGILLEKIYRGQCVSQQYSREMLNLLLHQTKRYKIPSGLPTGIVCANKTGETSSVQHDMAIVYGKKTNYVLCIFSEGASEDHLLYGIRSISSRVYQYLNK